MMDVNGLIIDLRHNDGGDFTYCFSEIGRLRRPGAVCIPQQDQEWSRIQ